MLIYITKIAATIFHKLYNVLIGLHICHVEGYCILFSVLFYMYYVYGLWVRIKTYIQTKKPPNTYMFQWLILSDWKQLKETQSCFRTTLGSPEALLLSGWKLFVWSIHPVYPFPPAFKHQVWIYRFGQSKVAYTVRTLFVSIQEKLNHFCTDYTKLVTYWRVSGAIFHET